MTHLNEILQKCVCCTIALNVLLHKFITAPEKYFSRQLFCNYSFTFFRAIKNLHIERGSRFQNEKNVKKYIMEFFLGQMPAFSFRIRHNKSNYGEIPFSIYVTICQGTENISWKVERWIGESGRGSRKRSLKI